MCRFLIELENVKAPFNSYIVNFKFSHACVYTIYHNMNVLFKDLHVFLETMDFKIVFLSKVFSKWHNTTVAKWSLETNIEFQTWIQ